MSQSNKSDPQKTNNTEHGGEESEPVSERPSADPTEEVVSAVNQFFGIGRDPSTANTNKKIVSDSKIIGNKAASDRSVTHQPAPTRTQDDSDARRQAETSKASDPKAPQTPIISRNVRESNSGRILAKSNSDRQTEQKQQGSERPSLDPTESVVSAVTQYFGIGQDDKPTQTKKITNIHNEQIVATSQQVKDNHDSSSDARKQSSSSKLPDSKVPSTVIAKHKSSPGTSTKGDTDAIPSNIHQGSNKKQERDDSSIVLRESQKLEPQQSSGRPSKDPTESIVSAVTQYFGIGQLAKSSKTKESANDGDEQTVAAAQNVVDDEESSNETRNQTSESKPRGTKVPPTVIAKQKPSLESSTKDESVASQPNAEQSSIRKQSQLVNETNNDRKTSRRLTETGETSSKRVTIAPGSIKSTTDESVVTAVTDVGISHSAQSEPVSKTDAAPLVITSSRQQAVETRSSLKDPIKHDDINVASKTISDPVEKARTDYPVSRNKEETARLNNDDIMASSTAESKVSPSPEAISTPITGPVTPHDHKDKKTPPSSTAQPIDKNKSESIKLTGTKDSTSHAVQLQQPQTVSTNELKPSGTEGTQNPVPMRAADSKVRPTSTTSSKEPKSVAESKVETPRRIDDQKQPDTATPKVLPGSEVSTIPAPVVVGKENGQDSNVSPTSVAMTKEPRSVTASNVEIARVMDDPKQSVSTTTAESKVPQSSAIQTSPTPLAVDSKGTQDSKVSPKGPQTVAASKVESPRTVDDHRQPDPAMTQDSKVSASPAVLATPPAGIVGKQDSKKSGVNETTAIPGDVRASGQSKETPSKVPATPVPAPVSEQPGIVASTNKVEIPQTVDIQKLPNTGRAVEANESSSSTAKETATPSAVKPQDRKDDSRKVDRSNGPSANSQPISVAATGMPQTDAASKTETPRTLKDLKKEESTKTDSNMPPSQATASSNDSTGQLQPISVDFPGKPQSVAASKTETPRTLNDPKVAESTKTVSNVPSSSPVTTVSPLVINAQDASKNKNISSNPPEDLRAIESSKTTNSKVPPISAGAPQQPQPVTANAAETQRTMEGQRPIEKTTTPKPAVSSGAGVSHFPPAPQQPQPVTAHAAETQRTMEGQRSIDTTTTPKSAVSSGPGVGTLPPPVIVNVQDRRQNDTNKIASTNVPPPPLVQPTEPAIGAASTGPTAVTGISGAIPIRGSHTSTATGRQCWICFATDEDELGLPWIQPCKCKGTTKWVHQSCLQMWVDEKLREHKDKKVACPQCKTEYLIYLPKANVLVRSFDQVDNVIYRVCPFIAAGVVIGSFYWNAVTYGAIVMLQVAGSEGAGVVAETFQPTVIIVGLPFVPLSLIVFRLFQWEDSFLYILRTTSHCVPLLQYILPGHVVNESGVITDVPATTSMSFQRVLAGALMTPVIAKICGNLFFPSVTSPVWRTVFGGALFVSVKGLIKMYHKQQTYKRLSRRKILDYSDENKRLIEQSRPPMMNQVAPTPLRFQFVASVENRRNRRR